MKCIFKLLIYCWCYKFSSWKEPCQSAMVAFLSYSWGISGPEKQQDLSEVRHTRLERSWPESTILAPLLYGASSILFWHATLIWPPLSLQFCLSPQTLLLQVESASCQLRRKEATEVRCEAKERGVLCLPSPQSCVHFQQDLYHMVQYHPRNNNNDPWFYSY